MCKNKKFEVIAILFLIVHLLSLCELLSNEIVEKIIYGSIVVQTKQVSVFLGLLIVYPIFEYVE